MSMNSDFIELDIVVTMDNELIALHNNELSETTNIATHGEY